MKRTARDRHVIRFAAAAAVAVVALGAGRAAAAGAQRTHAIIIGYNGVPASRAVVGPDELGPLRFADDDAAAVFALLRGFPGRQHLLTIVDPETQRRHPRLTALARPPSLAELRRVIAEVQRDVDDDVRAGTEPVVVIFYSGHGARLDDGPAALTLLDEGLTQQILYDEILANLRARYVHIFVDACQAAAVVRPRDLQSARIDVTPSDLAAFAARGTLARFPNVGAAIGATATAQAHEWDGYQQGIFTHQLLSALRGAADVNGDQLIEYSELAAFLAAANRGVDDARARLVPIVRAPAVNGRVAVLDLSRLRQAARLRGRAGHLGALFIEDSHGNRLADLRTETAFDVSLALPAGETLFVRAGDREAEIAPTPGQKIAFETLSFRRRARRERGAMDVSLRTGLFAARFGPNYYSGFVDHDPESSPVPLSLGAIDTEPPNLLSTTSTSAPPRASRAHLISWGAAAALLAGSGAFAALALNARSDFDASATERGAYDASDRYMRYSTLSIGLAVGSALSAAVGAYLWHDGRRPR